MRQGQRLHGVLWYVFAMGLMGTLDAATVSLPVVLVLEQIEQLKPNSTVMEDQVYVELTAYSNQQRPSQFFIPPKPNYWTQLQLSTAHDLALYKQEVGSDEAIELVISVVDKGLESWTVDETLGTFKLFIVNPKKASALEFLWAIPEQTEVVKEHEEGRQASFLLKASKGIYRVVLHIQTPTP